MPSAFPFVLPTEPIDYVVIAGNVVPPMPSRAISKIVSFANLANGWHFGAGRAPSPTMISKALGWHAKLRSLGFTLTDAFPGANGEIMVTAYEGNHYVEILLETDAAVSFVYERDDVEATHLDHVAPDRVSEKLQDIAGEIWSTSGYFTRNTLIASAMNSKAWHSKYMTTGLPLSSWPALPSVSATISANFIRTSGANLQFFGYSTKPSFLKIPA